MSKRSQRIASIVVAAGLSTRMGEPKQLLPYGEHTVIEHIVSVLLACPVEEVIVVTGHMQAAIEEVLAGWAVRTVFNPAYETGEMLSSVQCGLDALDRDTDAALIVLGDQPQTQAGVVKQIVTAYRNKLGNLVIPSFQMRRGHPILIDRVYWREILTLDSDKTLRDVIHAHADDIHHLTVDTDSVLRDIDTPAEYQQELRRLATKETSSS